MFDMLFSIIKQLGHALTVWKTLEVPTLCISKCQCLLPGATGLILLKY